MCIVSVSFQAKKIDFNYDTVFDFTMASDRKCEKCCLCIDSHIDLFTVCEGDCAGIFHAACVGLKEEDFDLLSRSQSILWMCEPCMYTFRKKRDCIQPRAVDNTESTKTIEREVKELKISVAGILETLSNIVPTTLPSAPNVLSSTPISSHALFEGTHGCDASVSNCESCDRPRDEGTTIDDYFALFLSNIDPSVTERDVRRMISNSLGTPEPECLDVVKLTKKWNNRRMLDFVSFKVIISKKLKTRALDPSTWPVNIKFREFVSKHNDTWRP